MLQGTLGGLAFWVIGLPSAVVWGLVMAFLSMIPFLGAFIVWVPAAIWLAASGHWGAAIGLSLWGSLVIGLIDNFLRPPEIVRYHRTGCRATRAAPRRHASARSAGVLRPYARSSTTSRRTATTAETSGSSSTSGATQAPR